MRLSDGKIPHMAIKTIKAAIYDAKSLMIQWVNVPVGEGFPMPEILIIDDHHYVRMFSDEPEPRYKLAIGRHTIRTRPMPIYLAKMFTQPLEFESKVFRLFSGCHGATTFVYECDHKVTWNTKAIMQVKGLTGIRINGVWSPELPREPGLEFEGAYVNDHALRALAAMREILRGTTGGRRPIIKFSALGVDEYGRLVCDIKLFEARTMSDDILMPVAPKALETGLFVPTVLDSQE